MLENAFQGFNTCIFAYGQTGSGKSYSIAGYGENKGIVPLLCEELFKRAERETKKGVPNGKRTEFRVTFSMLEIYNEVLQDLQVMERDRIKDGLKVRDRGDGTYVEGLKVIPCSSWAEMEMLQDMGNKNRTLGQTLMNATSSRAHTVNQIEFRQKFFDENNKPERELVSNIVLIDLAGSERANATGAAGGEIADAATRMKEGSNINKSLSTLGRVISSLAAICEAKEKGKTTN